MILRGDCVQVMQAIKPNSIDAIVTDPPYGLEFMGKKWDRLMRKDRKVAYPSCRSGHGPDAYQAGLEMQLWHSQWTTEAYRILKPGGSMLVMGGTRTFHRLMVAIEDSGFILKDTLMYLYGSGFPKAQDLGKMIDKRNDRNPCFEFKEYLNKKRIEKGLNFNQINETLNAATTGGGTASSVMGDKVYNNLPTLEIYKKLKKILNLDNRFDELIEREEAEREYVKKGMSGKTAIWNEAGEMGDFDITAPSTPLAKQWDGFKVGGIKPAYEPIVWAVKPPEGSCIDNVLKWGVGAVNVDECRIPGNWSGGHKRRNSPESKLVYGEYQEIETEQSPKGRFPANVILDEIAGEILDKQSGKSKGTDRIRHNRKDNYKFFSEGEKKPAVDSYGFADSGGASRFFYTAKASRFERNEGLEGMEKKDVPYSDYREKFDSTKSFVSEYPEGKPRPMNKIINNHPTVKPISLFEWLVKLVTRKGQIVLDPFLGSGTSLMACEKSGRKGIGIEKEAEYIEIAKARIKNFSYQKVFDFNS